MRKINKVLLSSFLATNLSLVPLSQAGVVLASELSDDAVILDEVVQVFDLAITLEGVFEPLPDETEQDAVQRAIAHKLQNYGDYGELQGFEELPSGIYVAEVVNELTGDLEYHEYNVDLVVYEVSEIPNLLDSVAVNSELLTELKNRQSIGDVLGLQDLLDQEVGSGYVLESVQDVSFVTSVHGKDYIVFTADVLDEAQGMIASDLQVVKLETAREAEEIFGTLDGPGIDVSVKESEIDWSQSELPVDGLTLSEMRLDFVYETPGDESSELQAIWGRGKGVDGSGQEYRVNIRLNNFNINRGTQTPEGPTLAKQAKDSFRGTPVRLPDISETVLKDYDFKQHISFSENVEAEIKDLAFESSDESEATVVVTFSDNSRLTVYLPLRQVDAPRPPVTGGDTDDGVFFHPEFGQLRGPGLNEKVHILDIDNWEDGVLNKDQINGIAEGVTMVVKPVGVSETDTSGVHYVYEDPNDPDSPLQQILVDVVASYDGYPDRYGQIELVNFHLVTGAYEDDTPNTPSFAAQAKNAIELSVHRVKEADVNASGGLASYAEGLDFDALSNLPDNLKREVDRYEFKELTDKDEVVYAIHFSDRSHLTVTLPIVVIKEEVPQPEPEKPMAERLDVEGARFTPEAPKNGTHYVNPSEIDWSRGIKDFNRLPEGTSVSVRGFENGELTNTRQESDGSISVPVLVTFPDNSQKEVRVFVVDQELIFTEPVEEPSQPDDESSQPEDKVPTDESKDDDESSGSGDDESKDEDITEEPEDDDSDDDDDDDDDGDDDDVVEEPSRPTTPTTRPDELPGRPDMVRPGDVVPSRPSRPRPEEPSEPEEPTVDESMEEEDEPKREPSLPQLQEETPRNPLPTEPLHEWEEEEDQGVQTQTIPPQGPVQQRPQDPQQQQPQRQEESQPQDDGYIAADNELFDPVPGSLHLVHPQRGKFTDPYAIDWSQAIHSWVDMYGQTTTPPQGTQIAFDGVIGLRNGDGGMLNYAVQLKITYPDGSIDYTTVIVSGDVDVSGWNVVSERQSPVMQGNERSTDARTRQSQIGRQGRFVRGEDGELVNTGEQRNALMIALASMFLVAGAGMVIFNRRKKNEEGEGEE